MTCNHGFPPTCPVCLMEQVIRDTFCEFCGRRTSPAHFCTAVKSEEVLA